MLLKLADEAKRILGSRGLPAKKQMHECVEPVPSATASGSSSSSAPSELPSASAAAAEEPPAREEEYVAGEADSDAEGSPAEPKLFDAAPLAFHGADGRPCRCDICRRIRHGRHYALSDLHPYSEAKVRRVPGAHSFGTLATHWDIIDFGPEAAWLQGARYDLYGFDCSTSLMMSAPLNDKMTTTLVRSIR